MKRPGIQRTEWKRKASTKSAAISCAERKEAGAVSKLRVAVQRSTPAKREPMKSKGPRMTPIRKAARGQDCTMRFPVCNGDRDTVVWAHSNNYRDGKGAGKKARDEEGCFACFKCHSFYDGGYANSGWTREAVEQFFDQARAESKPLLAAMGLIKDGTGQAATQPAPEHLSLEQ